MRLFFKYSRVNLSGALEYRASFYMSAFGMLLSNSTFVFFWYVAFEQIGGRIGGYDFRDVMFIWASCSSAFGLSAIVFGNAGSLSGMIARGEIDVFLLQPKNPLLSLLMARTSLSAWGDLAYGIVLMALTGQGARGWLFFALAIPLGGLLIAATGVLFGSLAFWFGDTSTAGSMSTEFVVNFCIYPEGIYPKAIRALMYTVIPAAFIVHVPLKLARGGSALWLPVWLLAAAAYVGVAVFVFNRGLKRYESGNLIVTRM